MEESLHDYKLGSNTLHAAYSAHLGQRLGYNGDVGQEMNWQYLKNKIARAADALRETDSRNLDELERLAKQSEQRFMSAKDEAEKIDLVQMVRSMPDKPTEAKDYLESLRHNLGAYHELERRLSVAYDDAKRLEKAQHSPLYDAAIELAAAMGVDAEAIGAVDTGHQTADRKVVGYMIQSARWLVGKKDQWEKRIRRRTN